MVRSCFFFVFVFIFTLAYSQTDSVEYVKDNDEIIIGSAQAEYRPVYNIDNLLGDKWTVYPILYNYIEIPKEYCDSTRKYVVLQFNVEKNCEIKNIEIVVGLEAKIDKEVVRVIKLLKCIKPAYTRGKPVQYKETIAFIFCKDKKNKSD
jgi:hypothetical protein